MSRNRDKVPPQAEFNKLVKFMRKVGMKPKDIKDLIGEMPKGRKRREIGDELKTWLKGRRAKRRYNSNAN